MLREHDSMTDEKEEGGKATCVEIIFEHQLVQLFRQAIVEYCITQHRCGNERYARARIEYANVKLQFCRLCFG